MTDLHHPQFYVAHIAAATGVSANTIRQWYKREVLVLGSSDADAETLGLARSFSGATALAIAIMGELIKVGTAPNLAARAALAFAHTGKANRRPGHLFPTGETLLIVSPTNFEIINISPDTSLASISRPYPISLLWLDELVDRVRIKLGFERDPLHAPTVRTKPVAKISGSAKYREKARA